MFLPPAQIIPPFAIQPVPEAAFAALLVVVILVVVVICILLLVFAASAPEEGKEGGNGCKQSFVPIVLVPGRIAGSECGCGECEQSDERGASDDPSKGFQLDPLPGIV